MGGVLACVRGSIVGRWSFSVRAALSQLAHDVQSLKGHIMSELTNLRDELSGVFADLSAKIDRLQASTALSAEDRTTLDEIKSSVDAARAKVGDENADGVPAAPPVEPSTGDTFPPAA